MPNNVGSPASSDPTFNMNGQLGPGPSGPTFSTGPNRMNPGKNQMMPPPSPAMNGPPKDQNSGPGGPNNGKNPNMNNTPNNSGHPDGSPRNQPPNSGNNSGQTPNPGGTGPPTPAPNNKLGPGPGQVQNMAPSPSPSSVLNNIPLSMNASSMGGPPGMGPDSMAPIFPTDFIQSVASSLDDFDSPVFRPDGDINFERDFGQWFNPDEAMGIDMK